MQRQSSSSRPGDFSAVLVSAARHAQSHLRYLRHEISAAAALVQQHRRHQEFSVCDICNITNTSFIFNCACMLALSFSDTQLALTDQLLTSSDLCLQGNLQSSETCSRLRCNHQLHAFIRNLSDLNQRQRRLSTCNNSFYPTSATRNTQQ